MIGTGRLRGSFDVKINHRITSGLALFAETALLFFAYITPRNAATIEDTTPPIVTVLSDIIVNATSLSGAVVTFIASATDGEGLAKFNCAPPPGSTFPIGNTTVRQV